MSEFNDGDKVRLVRNTEPNVYAEVGQIGTVTQSPYHSYTYDLEVEFTRENGSTYTQGAKDDQFELVTDTEARMVFEGGGMREPQDGKPRFDLLLPEGVPFAEQFLTRFAVHMTKGAAKYEDRNWEKFSDKEALERAKASALRHIMQWLSGETDEDHAAAVVFNLMAAEHVKRKMESQ